jgi:hypothetical protein
MMPQPPQQAQPPPPAEKPKGRRNKYQFYMKDAKLDFKKAKEEFEKLPDEERQRYQQMADEDTERARADKRAAGVGGR